MLGGRRVEGRARLGACEQRAVERLGEGGEGVFGNEAVERDNHRHAGLDEDAADRLGAARTEEDYRRTARRVRGEEGAQLADGKRAELAELALEREPVLVGDGRQEVENRAVVPQRLLEPLERRYLELHLERDAERA